MRKWNQGKQIQIPVLETNLFTHMYNIELRELCRNRGCYYPP